MTRRKKTVIGVLAGAVAAACALGSGRTQSFAPPEHAVTSISSAEYEGLLRKYVSESGKVDYVRWHDDAADVAALDRYLSVLTHATPDTNPELYPTQLDKKSYWLNLYNALVLREILRRWPLDSVTDVRINATSFVKAGKGFFYDLTFEVGGKKMNLYDLENQIIRSQFNDARIHFAINCGSTSCPVLRRDAFDAKGLDAQLETASAAFVNDGKSVVVDDGQKKVRMSKIFEWYADDFVAFTKTRTSAAEATVVDFALLYATPPLLGRLENARAMKYSVAFTKYDWAVNKGTEESRADAATRPTLVGTTLPDVAFELLDGGGSFEPATHRGHVVLLDFWATYCRPCKASFPRLQAFAEKYRERGLVVVGVSMDEAPREVVPGFVAETGAKFQIAFDPKQLAASALHVTAMPTELLVDRRGIVRYRHEGLADGEMDQIERELTALLDEPDGNAKRP